MKKTSEKKGQKNPPQILLFILFAVFAFAIMYICTSSSPRYGQNPWVDANAFFTVGKGMARGLIPYKDLFEQKGPLLYFIHCLSYWISNTSFTGVYIFESLAMTATLFFTYKTAALYLSLIPSVLTSVLTGTVIANSFCLYFGDSAEEFCLPMLMIGMYYIIRYFKTPTTSDYKWYIYLFCGFLAGCIAMIKYSVLGVWFAWMAILALYTLIAKKEVKKAFINSFVFLGGMILAVIPWLVYFAVNGALKDFIDTYFLINSNSYSTNSSDGIGYLISTVFDRYLVDSKYCAGLGVIAVTGVLFTVFSKKIFPEKIFPHFVLPLFFVSNIFFTYIGVRLPYYYLTFAIFVPAAFIGIMLVFGMLIKDKKSRNAVSATCLTIMVILSIPLSMKINHSSNYADRKVEDTIQYEYIQYMNEHNPNGTLLNLGSLDTGFYVQNNTLPPVKHFEQQNIRHDKYPENIDEQTRYVNECLTDYIILRKSVRRADLNAIYQTYPTLKTDYNLVKSEMRSIMDINRDKGDFIYYLFEKK